jgi:hypothetical protein
MGTLLRASQRDVSTSMSFCMRSLYPSDQCAPGLALFGFWDGEVGVGLLSLEAFRAPVFSLSVGRDTAGLEIEFELFMRSWTTSFSVLLRLPAASSLLAGDWSLGEVQPAVSALAYAGWSPQRQTMMSAVGRVWWRVLRRRRIRFKTLESAADHVLDFSTERLYCEWLCHDLHPDVEMVMVDDGVFRIPSNKQYLKIGA